MILEKSSEISTIWEFGGMDSKKFKSWRKALGLTQAEAAKMLGLGTPTITLYERGSRHGDSRPVAIPRTVELACFAISKNLSPSVEEPDRVVERHGFVSREPATRVKRTRLNGPIEVLSIKGPLEVMNRFKTYCNEEGFTSYWQGLDALLKKVKR